MTPVSEFSTLRPVGEPQTGIPMVMIFMNGAREAEEMKVFINGSAIVGRGQGCDIFIDDETLSRQHFVIEYRSGEFYIQDLETTNGTFLNGVRLSHKRRLEKGDIIKAGALELLMRW